MKQHITITVDSDIVKLFKVKHTNISQKIENLMRADLDIPSFNTDPSVQDDYAKLKAIKDNEIALKSRLESLSESKSKLEADIKHKEEEEAKEWI